MDAQPTDKPAPPIDSDGRIIGDLPWKFFDPAITAAVADLREKG